MRQKPWDLLLLDLSLPDKNGLDILQDIKHAQPVLPVLIFSGKGENEFAVAALNAGSPQNQPGSEPPARWRCGSMVYP